MYRSIEITNYRCFDHLRVDDLARVNIICGANNSGKTALLEAVYLLAMRGDRLAVLDVVRRFGGEPLAQAQRFWEPLFHRFRTDEDVSLAARSARGQASLEELSEETSVVLHEVSDREGLDASLAEWTRRMPPVERDRLVALEVDSVLRIDSRGPLDGGPGYLTPADAGKHRRPLAPKEAVPFIPSRTPFAGADGARFKEVAVAKQTPEVVEALDVIEPRLTDLRSVDGTATIYGDIGLPHLMPLTDMGEGMQRLLSLTLALWTAKGGVVLIDEVENGLHHTILPKVWTLIGEAARRFDVQVFATTHSRECIAAAHDAFCKQRSDDLRLVRLQRVRDEMQSIGYRCDVLEAALETGLEVR